MNNIKNLKKVIIVMVLALSFIFISWLVYYLTAKGDLIVSRPIDFEREVTFKLDGKEYTTPADIKEIIGSHTISSNPEGTIPFKKEVTIKRFEKKEVHLVLLPSNPNDEAIGEWESVTNTDTAFKNAQKNNPLTSYLPYFSDTYNITYDLDQSTGKVTYYIEMNDREPATTTPVINEVDNFVQSKGIDPKSINFQWRDKTI